jgi:uncharacterized protein (TIGR00369 family)
MQSAMPSSAHPRPEAATEIDLDPIRGGFRGFVGYKLIAWDAGSAVVGLDIRDEHLNRSRVVHGGVIATLLDAAGGYSGLYCIVSGNVRTCVSISFSELFIAPGRPPRIEVRARQVSATRKTFFTEASAYNADGTLIGTAQAVYRWADGSERPEGVRLEAGA